MKKQWIWLTVPFALMSAVSFKVVADEPWQDVPPPITVPGDPFDPPPTTDGEPAPAVDYRCEAAANAYGPGGWLISCVNDEADEDDPAKRLQFNFDRPLPPEADS